MTNNSAIYGASPMTGQNGGTMPNSVFREVLSNPSRLGRLLLKGEPWRKNEEGLQA